MNIRKIISISSLCLIALSSCNKEDVIDLKNEYGVDALTNPSSIDQVEQVLTGAYASFRSGGYYGLGYGTLADIMSDNLIETNESLANYRVMSDWRYTSDNGTVQSLFAAPYLVISRANIVLRDIDKFTTSANQKRANRIKAQALTIRAMAHFDLLRYFGLNFNANDNASLALPYIKTFAVGPSQKPPRITNSAYFQEINADLNLAEELYKNIDKSINSTGLTRPYIDSVGFAALKTRISLYTGDWENCIKYATKVLNVIPLADNNDFPNMYNETALGEMVWCVKIDAGQGSPGSEVYFSNNDINIYRPADEIATIAATSGIIQADDVRYNSFFSVVPKNGVDRFVVSKYNGRNNATDGNTNFIVFRAGEALISRAEAKYLSGDESGALADLNALRTQRINQYTPVTLSGTQLLNAIRDERRGELFCEGHRFFDLKRTSKTIQRSSGCGNPGVSPAGACSLQANAREWALPIPEYERRTNPLTQNPGY